MARHNTTTANAAAMPAVPMSVPVAPPTAVSPMCTGKNPVATPTIARPANTAATTTSTMNVNVRPLRQTRSALPIAASVFAAAVRGASGMACAGAASSMDGVGAGARAPSRGTSMVATTPCGAFASSVSLPASP